jgi:hypothetical protein
MGQNFSELVNEHGTRVQNYHRRRRIAPMADEREENG